MRKIPTIFVRDFERDNGRYVTDQVTPGCEWVLAGEGVPTRKRDGTCVMLTDIGEWWSRREIKPGGRAPHDFWGLEEDSVTGKIVGWVPIGQSGFRKFHDEALTRGAEASGLPFMPGTYELCGPKINGNPERVENRHVLARHGSEPLSPDLFNGGVEALMHNVRSIGVLGVEGVVWWHADGRMAKLKARDIPSETTS